MRVLYPILLFFGSLLLFNFSGCEECELFNFGAGPDLKIDLGAAPSVVQVGDTVWIGTSFPATQTIEGSEYVISEGGGIVITRVYRLATARDTMRPGRGEFTVVEEEGFVQPYRVSGDSAAVVTRFLCPDGACRFRTGFQATRPGTYLFEVRGGGIDLLSNGFSACGDPAFGPTILEGNRNLDVLNIPEVVFVTGRSAGFRDRFITELDPVFAVEVAP